MAFAKPGVPIPQQPSWSPYPHKHRRHTSRAAGAWLPAPPGVPVLTFTGVGFGTHTEHAFEAMPGANAPTITDGYAVWSQVQRPLNRSLTTAQGYGANTMTVDVVLAHFDGGGNWIVEQDHQGALEGTNGFTGISALEWMAGGRFHGGPSPAVYVNSYGPRAGTTDLIPPHYQGISWVISQLQWGNAIRNSRGFRVWQEATVTLIGYLSIGRSAPHAKNERHGGYFTTTSSRRTALQIASAPSSRSPAAFHQILAKRIVQSDRNKHLYNGHPNIYRKLKVGVKVWVPEHVAVT